MAYIPDKAHVQHAVGLIENKDFNLGQADSLSIQKVDKPTRCRDNDIDTTGQRPYLRSHSDAAINGERRNLRITAIIAKVASDLIRKLARRRQDQGAGETRSRRCLTGDELLENGERERSGLAGPSLGYSEDIAPRKDKRNGLGLNGCGHDIVSARTAFRTAGQSERFSKEFKLIFLQSLRARKQANHSIPARRRRTNAFTSMRTPVA